MNAAPLALNACAATVFRLVEAHGCDAAKELIEPVSEQRFVFFERTQRNSRLQARVRLVNVVICGCALLGYVVMVTPT